MPRKKAKAKPKKKKGAIPDNVKNKALYSRVKAEAKKGQANHAVCNVLSKIFSSTVSVVSGHTTRNKKIRVEALSCQQIITILEGYIES